MNLPFPDIDSKAVRWAMVLLAILGILWASLGTWSCLTTRKANQTNQLAAQAHLAATASAAQGEVHDQEAATLAAQVQSREQDVARKRAKVVRLQAAAADPRPEAAQPGRVDLAGRPAGEAPAEDGELPRLRALSSAQSELIDSLTQAGRDKDALIASLTAARNEYRTALTHEMERARLLEIAQDARLAAVKAERWQGRGEGVLLVLVLTRLL